MLTHTRTASTFLNLGSASSGPLDPFATSIDGNGPRLYGAGAMRLSGFGFTVPAWERVIALEVQVRARHDVPLLPDPAVIDLRVARYAEGVTGTAVPIAVSAEPSWSTSTTTLTAPNRTALNASDFGVVLSSPTGTPDVAYAIDSVALVATTEPLSVDREEEPMSIRYLNETITVWRQWTDPTGLPLDPTGSVSVRIYDAATDAPVWTGTMSRLDDANSVGLMTAQVVVSTANGFAVDRAYCVRATATVDGSAQAAIVERFVLRATPAAAVWNAPIPTEAVGAPATMGATLRRLLSKAANRLVKQGDLVRTYADDSTTVVATQGYAVTSGGFDRSRDQ